MSVRSVARGVVDHRASKSGVAVAAVLLDATCDQDPTVGQPDPRERFFRIA